MIDENKIYDLFVIGGGVNGTAIARDAVGRGLNVTLAEKGDLAEATSSASTKLFHGGLRYLEYFEFQLVRHALREREVLLRNMPHISWPMRFVLPYHPGRRPAWLLRFGLFLYDSLGGRKLLPATRKLNLKTALEGSVLQDRFEKAFEYSDAWVQDSRLVVLMAADAQNRGANIMTQNKVLKAERQDDLWHIETERGSFKSKILVNAAGPWVEDVIRDVAGLAPQSGVRLVKGSHIVLDKLYTHDKCYFFQGNDGRIIFAIPYENDFTLIGTTDQPHALADAKPECTDEEAEYLCKFASEYFEKPVLPRDIVWRYSGVRPLFDDGAKSATAATRDYVLSVNDAGPPLLSVFGGKITTHRVLAES
ncbi:UNVERIFIED_CONTAM: hypothetical protein GTU68_022534, partial [Idotea baltica]|nr:hypothetical protein [Idotea baltica]